MRRPGDKRKRRAKWSSKALVDAMQKFDKPSLTPEQKKQGRHGKRHERKTHNIGQTQTRLLISVSTLIC